MNVWHTYRSDAADPPIPLLWLDAAGSVLDMSTATFEVSLVDHHSGETKLVKTSGVVGTDSNPNVTVIWDADELATVPPSTYLVVVKADVAGRARYFTDVHISVVAPPAAVV